MRRRASKCLGDSAYGAGAFRAELAARGWLAIIKPAPRPRVVAGGFTVDDSWWTTGRRRSPALAGKRLPSRRRAGMSSALSAAVVHSGTAAPLHQTAGP